MRTVAEAGIAMLGLAALVLLAAAVAGATLGVFFGVLVWTVETVAGSVGSAVDGVSPWWALALLAVLLATEAMGRRCRRRNARQETRGGAAAQRGAS